MSAALDKLKSRVAVYNRSQERSRKGMHSVSRSAGVAAGAAVGGAAGGFYGDGVKKMGVDLRLGAGILVAGYSAMKGRDTQGHAAMAGMGDGLLASWVSERAAAWGREKASGSPAAAANASNAQLEAVQGMVRRTLLTEEPSFQGSGVVAAEPIPESLRL